MFNIGSLVALKGNPGIKMTVCSGVDKYNKGVYCAYINKSLKIEKEIFPIECLELYEENLKEIQLQKIPFLYSDTGDCYTFFEYASIFGQKVNKNTPKDEEMVKNAKFVYDFKKYYPRNKQDVFNLLTMAKHYLNCEQIICIPGHTIELNSMQKIFGCEIERIREV